MILYIYFIKNKLGLYSISGPVISSGLERQSDWPGTQLGPDISAPTATSGTTGQSDFGTAQWHLCGNALAQLALSAPGWKQSEGIPKFYK